MSARKKVSERRARSVAKLVAAMDRCAVARAEAQWTNGYRAMRESYVSSKDAEAVRLRDKESQQWLRVDRADAAFRRLAQRLLRDARRGLA